MAILFLLSMVSFLGLFLALLALVRRAVARAAAAPMARPARSKPRARTPHLVRRESLPGTAEPSPLPEGFDGGLSKLVPGKQPDWRFMVREPGTKSVARRYAPAQDEAKQAAPAKPARPDWAYYNEDLGDLRDPYEPGESFTARRA